MLAEILFMEDFLFHTNLPAAFFYGGTRSFELQIRTEARKNSTYNN